MPSRYLFGQMPIAQPLPSQRRGPDPSFFEGVGASFRTTIDEQDIPQAQRIADAYRPVEDALIDMGVDRKSLHPTIANDPRMLAQGQGFAAPTVDYLDPDRVWSAVNAARARDPKAFKDLPKTRAEFEKDALTRHGARANDQYMIERSGLGAQLLGGAAASFADPVNVLTAPIGGGGKTIAQTILREAIVNAATEALQQPALADAKTRLGETLTAGDVAMNIATAGVAGGVLGGAGKTVELHAGTVGPRLADARESAIAKVWDRLPAPLRERWKSAANVTDDDLPEIADATIGATNLSTDERAAMAVIVRERQIDAANPFVRNGAGVAAHREQLGDAIARVLADVPPPAPSTRARLSASTAIAGGGVSDVPARAMLKNRIAVVESAGGANYANPLSSARGKYQFLSNTWLHYYKQRFGAGGLSDDAILAKRADPRVQDTLMDDMTSDNAAFLRRAGEAETAGNLYLVHFAGQGGARRLFEAEPTARAIDVMGEKVVRANPWMRDMTAGDVIRWASRKMDETAPARGGARGPIADGAGGERAGIQAELDRLQAERTAIAEPANDIAEPSATDILADAAEPVIVDTGDLPEVRTAPQAAPEVAAIEAPAIAGRLRTYASDPARPSLLPAKVAKAMGISEQEAEAALAKLAGEPGSGLRRTADRMVGGNGQHVLKPGRIMRAPVNRGPVDLLRFLSDAGGLRDTEGHDLAAGMGLQKFVPASGMLIRENGMTIDAARELAAEHGYFHDRSPDDAIANTTNADFLELLDSARGGDHYALGDVLDAEARARDKEIAAELAQIRGHIDTRLTEHGFAFDAGRVRRAAELVQREGLTSDDAILKVVNEDMADALDAARLEAEKDHYAAVADEIERTLASDAGRGADGVDGSRPDARDAGEGGAGAAQLRRVDSGEGPLNPDSVRAFDDPDAQAAIAQVDSLDHDLRAMIDPAIAERQAQEAALKAGAPMRAAVDQETTIGSPLFDAVDQTKLQLDDGKPVTLRELFADLDDEEAAIKSVRDCL